MLVEWHINIVDLCFGEQLLSNYSPAVLV